MARASLRSIGTTSPNVVPLTVRKLGDGRETLATRWVCQFLLDRQEIAPGEPLLQRTAQQERRVISRNSADFTLAGMERKPASARPRDSFLGAEQSLGRRIAEADQ